MTDCTGQDVLDVAHATRDTLVKWAGCTYRQCRRAAILVDLMLDIVGCPPESRNLWGGWLGRITRESATPARNTGHVWNLVTLEGTTYLLDVTADQFSPLLKKQFPPIVWGPYEEMLTKYSYIPGEPYGYSSYDVDPGLVANTLCYLHTGTWMDLPPQSLLERRCSMLWRKRAGQ